MGLVSYESSDEEEAGGESPASQQVLQPPAAEKSAKLPTTASQQTGLGPRDEIAIPTNDGASSSTTGLPAPAKEPASEALGPAARETELGPTLGPALGPARPQMDAVELLPEASPEPPEVSGPPRSPYSAARSLLRDLTLPTVPNLDIPPSPPGTPPPSLEGLNRKFDTFLDLKRTQGVHFNERLAQSAALRNPGLMDKLLGFVGLETDFDDGAGLSQYDNVLSSNLWDPTAFPGWAYKGALRQAQDKAHERPRGERVEFVSASEPGPRSRSGTPGVPPTTTGKRKTRFDA